MNTTTLDQDPSRSAHASRLTTRRAVLASALMVGAAGAAYWLEPRPTGTGPVRRGQLNAMVPVAFGAWREIQSAGSIVNPGLEETLQSLYADQLARNYVNSAGQQVMLSLAYGQNQNRDLQIHKPEVCYVAQGFKLISSTKSTVKTQLGDVPALQLVTQLGPRHEPVTYWIRVGDAVVRGWFEQNLARVRNGLAGTIPDGLLVRVSSIDRDDTRAFGIHQQFLADLLSALQPENRAMFVGTLASAVA